MSDEIKPALSPAEWDEYLNSGRRSPTAEDGFEQNRESGGHTPEEMRRVYLKDAARALHQAGRHGFTWHDVDAIEAAAEACYDRALETGDEEVVGALMHEGGHLQSIAKRIAALLPPREP